MPHEINHESSLKSKIFVQIEEEMIFDPQLVIFDLSDSFKIISPFWLVLFPFLIIKILNRSYGYAWKFYCDKEKNYCVIFG